jgi:hypothetical protein
MSKSPPLPLGLAILWTFTLPLNAWSLDGAPAGRLSDRDWASAGAPADIYAGRYTEDPEPGLLPEVPARPLGTPYQALALDPRQLAEYTSRHQPVPPVGDEAEYYTLEELKAEMKKAAWTKGNLRIVPYGYLWANMVYATQKTFPGSYTLYVPSADTVADDEFVVDARSISTASSSPRTSPGSCFAMPTGRSRATGIGCWPARPGTLFRRCLPAP